MSPKKTLRAALYVRLSQETETSTSVTRQREITSAYAAGRFDERGDPAPWKVIATFEDVDVSATHSRLNRPGLDALRARIAADEVDVVVVWRLDRLARKTLDLLTLLDEWGKKDVAVASATEAVDLTSAQGKAMATLIGVFAEMEGDAIRERVTSSIHALRHSGRFSGGAVGFGYTTAPRVDGPGVALVPIADEVAILSECADRLIAGESPWRICRDLNNRGVPAPRSEVRRLIRAGKDATGADRGTWSTTPFRTTMTSPHLLGRQSHRGDVIRDEAGLPLAVWPPLLDRPRVDAVAALLAHAERGQPRRKRSRLLSGLMVCDGCGKNMVVTSSRGIAAYRCMGKTTGATCDSPTVSAHRAEAHVVAEVLAAVGERRITETVSEESPLTAAARATLLDVATAIGEASAAMGADDADVAALLARLATLKAERARLRAEAESGAVLAFVRDTGRSWANDWHAAEVADTLAATRLGDASETDARGGVRDVVTARQLLLAPVVARVRLTGFAPASRKFDPSRLVIDYIRDDVSVA
ncbi:recombinase family protein [Knoellia sp. S7-12]|uniref:recombinase family protein n=1 Tax=Knoellia sp. S7-12 TaxID=3126698 RepID=UPI003366019A